MLDRDFAAVERCRSNSQGAAITGTEQENGCLKAVDRSRLTVNGDKGDQPVAPTRARLENGERFYGYFAVGFYQSELCNDLRLFAGSEGAGSVIENNH